jgi:hypothetical protein
LAASVLGAPVPATILEALKSASPNSVRKAAGGLSVSDMMRRTQRPPLRTLAQRLRRGIADRTETARWAHSVPEWLRVWWTLVDVRRTDTWQILRQSTGNA